MRILRLRATLAGSHSLTSGGETGLGSCWSCGKSTPQPALLPHAQWPQHMTRLVPGVGEGLQRIPQALQPNPGVGFNGISSVRVGLVGLGRGRGYISEHRSPENIFEPHVIPKGPGGTSTQAQPVDVPGHSTSLSQAAVWGAGLEGGQALLGAWVWCPQDSTPLPLPPRDPGS